MIVGVKRLDERAIIPRYATHGSAGFDLHALDSGVVRGGETVVVRTGLAMEIPKDHALLVFPRSGLATKWGVVLANTVGDQIAQMSVDMFIEAVRYLVPEAFDK